jgi:hypothetical protein
VLNYELAVVFKTNNGKGKKKNKIKRENEPALFEIEADHSFTGKS